MPMQAWIREKALWALMGGLLVVVAGFATYWQLDRVSVPIPAEISSRADFSVYYPSRLPDGYTLAAESVGGTTDTVHYTLTRGSQDAEITVTLQKTPHNFDASKLIGGTSIPTSIVENGTLYNLSTGSSSKYMLNTGDGTLVFFNSPGTIAAKDLNSIVTNLELINN